MSSTLYSVRVTMSIVRDMVGESSKTATCPPKLLLSMMICAHAVRVQFQSRHNGWPNITQQKQLQLAASRSPVTV